jgi:Vanillate O-demethylase oxygenase C-terminal domain
MIQNNRILPSCRFCLGHIANLKEGNNSIEFQGQHLLFYRVDKELDLAMTIIPNDLTLHLENGFLWLEPNANNSQKNYSKPILEKFISWPTTTITYQYEAPFKVVMENLYDINHIAGTHAETLFAKRVEILNNRTVGDTTTYTLKTHQNVQAFKKFPLYQKLLFWLLRRGKREKVIQEQAVSIYFPGVLVIEDPEEYKNKELERLTVVTIYPRNENSTAIVVSGQAKINPLLLKILQLLNRGENKVLKEDKRIMEHCYLEYNRKIKLTADEIVDSAREKYALYSKH